MQYINIYHSPLGEILLTCNDTGLTGLWYKDQKYYASTLTKEYIQTQHPILASTRLWLDEYFAGKNPEFTPPIHPIGTPFQTDVWSILCEIPYGETTTYGNIAAKFAQMRRIPSMSAQAVGAAVGRNPISIIVPCHRVIGAKGRLTGYAGGTDKKAYLLALEEASYCSSIIR